MVPTNTPDDRWRPVPATTPTTQFYAVWGSVALKVAAVRWPMPIGSWEGSGEWHFTLVALSSAPTPVLEVASVQSRR